MRTLDEYMKLPYRMEIVEDPYEGGYVVSFPELPGCLTYGDTIESALEYAEALDEYSGQFKLRIPKSLHRALAEHSKREGISMNQYCLYLLSKNDALYARG